MKIDNIPVVTSKMKSLVVYYSRTGNAKFVAQTIPEQLESEIEEIKDLKSREGTLGWISAGRDATQGKQAQIAETTKNPADFDLIILGTPVWAWSPTPAIRAYIAKNNLAEKKVALFFTLDNKPRQAIEKTKALMPNATFIGELAVTKALANKEETQKKVAEWCKSLPTA